MHGYSTGPGHAARRRRAGCARTGPGPLVLVVLATLAGAVAPAAGRAQPPPADPLVSVIVELDAAPLATYAGDIAGLAATSPAARRARRLDVQSPAARAYASFLRQREQAFASALGAIPRARIVHSLHHVIGGVSLVLPRSQVASLAALPGVRAVYPGRSRRLKTNRSPAFVGAPGPWQVAGGLAHAGEGVVIGVIDSGAWPEHPSFADPDAAGWSYPPPPPRWTGTACEFGSPVEGDAPFACNHKLIGARRFMAAYEAEGPLPPAAYLSARDDHGHGTHTATTAAGNHGVEAVIMDIPRGPVSGIAPRAHVAVYKACGFDGRCESADLVKAIDQAVADGVDVINYSIGDDDPANPEEDPDSNPYANPEARAFLDAYAAGVFVAVAAGNEGPDDGSIPAPANAPWVTSVGATTLDRLFMSREVRLREPGGAVLALTGTSITAGLRARPVVRAGDFGDRFCRHPFPPGTFQGQVVVCETGPALAAGMAADDDDSGSPSFNVARGGAAAMLLFSHIPATLTTDNHFVPAVHMDAVAGRAMLDFLSAHPRATASFQEGSEIPTTGDVVTLFSSRGGTGQGLHTIKPDVTAPGLHILAGHTPRPATVGEGLPGQLFQSDAGTSMASPHVAGLAALLRQLHPEWTPGQIRSALMTTAIPAVLGTGGGAPATPFERGAGRAAGRAWRATLTLDASAEDFRAHREDPWNINLPSLYHPGLAGALTVTRTVRNDLPAEAEWALAATAPPGLSVSVTPGAFTVPAGGDVALQITVDASAAPPGTHFATIILRPVGAGRVSDEVLRLPVAVRKP